MRYDNESEESEAMKVENIAYSTSKLCKDYRWAYHVEFERRRLCPGEVGVMLKRRGDELARGGDSPVPPLTTLNVLGIEGSA
jgi:hypothetical protein